MQPFNIDEARERIAAGFPLVNDHPDIAGVLRQPDLLALLGPALAYPFRKAKITAVIAPEARGPIVGALVATELGAGLVLARKDDRNHPGADIHVDSSPTWRGHSERFQGRSFDLDTDDRVLVVDDWITTGNSIRATLNMVRILGPSYAGAAVVVNKADPPTIKELKVHTLVDFDQLVDPS